MGVLFFPRIYKDANAYQFSSFYAGLVNAYGAEMGIFQGT